MPGPIGFNSKFLNTLATTYQDVQTDAQGASNKKIVRFGLNAAKTDYVVSQPRVGESFGKTGFWNWLFRSKDKMEANKSTRFIFLLELLREFDALPKDMSFESFSKGLVGYDQLKDLVKRGLPETVRNALKFDDYFGLMGDFNGAKPLTDYRVKLVLDAAKAYKAKELTPEQDVGQDVSGVQANQNPNYVNRAGSFETEDKKWIYAQGVDDLKKGVKKLFEGKVSGREDEFQGKLNTLKYKDHTGEVYRMGRVINALRERGKFTNEMVSRLSTEPGKVLAEINRPSTTIVMLDGALINAPSAQNAEGELKASYDGFFQRHGLGNETDADGKLRTCLIGMMAGQQGSLAMQMISENKVLAEKIGCPVARSVSGVYNMTHVEGRKFQIEQTLTFDEIFGRKSSFGANGSMFNQILSGNQTFADPDNPSRVVLKITWIVDGDTLGEDGMPQISIGRADYDTSYCCNMTLEQSKAVWRNRINALIKDPMRGVNASTNAEELLVRKAIFEIPYAERPKLVESFIKRHFDESQTKTKAAVCSRGQTDMWGTLKTAVFDGWIFDEGPRAFARAVLSSDNRKVRRAMKGLRDDLNADRLRELISEEEYLLLLRQAKNAGFKGWGKTDDVNEQLKFAEIFMAFLRNTKNKDLYNAAFAEYE